MLLEQNVDDESENIIISIKTHQVCFLLRCIAGFADSFNKAEDIFIDEPQGKMSEEDANISFEIIWEGGELCLIGIWQVFLVFDVDLSLKFNDFLKFPLSAFESIIAASRVLQKVVKFLLILFPCWVIEHVGVVGMLEEEP